MHLPHSYSAVILLSKPHLPHHWTYPQSRDEVMVLKLTLEIGKRVISRVMVLLLGSNYAVVSLRAFHPLLTIAFKRLSLAHYFLTFPPYSHHFLSFFYTVATYIMSFSCEFLLVFFPSHPHYSFLFLSFLLSSLPSPSFFPSPPFFEPPTTIM